MNPKLVKNPIVIIGTGGGSSVLFKRLVNRTITTVTDDDLSGLTEIGRSAFRDCDELTSINIPVLVTNIEDGAFCGCAGLTNVVVPDSVTNIGAFGFEYCTGLRSIRLGSGVSHIGEYAFYGCTRLKNIIILATTPPTLDGWNAISNTNNCPIYVPTPEVYVDEWSFPERYFPLVNTVLDLDNIDETVYTKACVVDGGNYTEYFYDGTQWNPIILIRSQADLAAMPASGSYRLANDITISGEWDYSTPFIGTFDGAEYTISYFMDAVVQGGLFRQLSTDNNGHSATIKNLTIVQVNNVTCKPVEPGGSASKCVGVLAASIEYPSDPNNTAITANPSNTVTIQNVNVTANLSQYGVVAQNARMSVGGIVGEIGMITRIENCKFNGSVSDTQRTDRDNNKYTSGYGGIVGTLVRNGGSLTVYRCINNGGISAFAQVGGILGHCREWGGGATAPAALTIEQCINNGTVFLTSTSTGTNGGGVVGFLYAKNGATAILRACINTGTVNKTNPNEDPVVVHLAGFVGALRRNGNNVKFIGCLQESTHLAGNQILTALLGSGDPTFENNYGRLRISYESGGVEIVQCEKANDPTTYADAYNTLNTAYPGVYVFANDIVSLAWVA